MTRLPADSRDVKGQGFSPSQKLEEVCAHPTCEVSGRENLELHELWPRSFLRGQPIEFVKLWDGTLVGNQVYLCNSFQNGHHQAITENKAWIRWFGMAFWWVENGEGWKLSYQPEIIVSHSKPSDTSDEGIPYPDAPKPAEATTEPPTVVHGGKAFHLIGDVASLIPKEGETCPTCERTVPVKKKREKAKNRVTYSFRVPKDKVEDGSDVLEELVVEVEKTLKPGEDPRPMYFTLCDALGLILVNKDVIL